MPLAPRTNYNLPDMWNIFGHSYWQFTGGAVDQTGRPDAIFRSSMDVEYTNWINHAVPGAQLIIQGRSLGGFARVLQERNPNVGRGAPYAADGGAVLFGWGINDLGNSGRDANHQACFAHCLRTVISYWRASTLYDDGFQVGTRTTYGAGFVNVSGVDDWAIGSTTRDATALTNATITMTLPSDYAGEPVAVCFTGQSIGFGGTVTFSGTTGVSGTLAIGINPQFSHAVLVKRFTGLTAANAGQTIVATVTQLDSGGTVSFQGWWLEAKAAPPVLVANVARLTAAGYALYASWPGTEAQKDQDVLNLNAAIQSVVAEFDSMVQVIDMDGLLNKDPTFMWDGLHPNEFGAARIADACLAAVKRMSPVSGLGQSASFNPPSPRSGPIIRPRRGGTWYTAEYRATGTAYTPVVGDLWAIPYVVSQGRERLVRMAMRLAGGGTVAGTIRWGVYDDPAWTGYPQCLMQELTTVTGPLSVGTVAGIVQNPAIGSNGSVNLALDPALYWLVIKVIAAGTGQTWETLAGPIPFVMPHLDAAAARITPAGFKLTGQGTTALPTTFPGGGVATDNAPLVAVQKF